MVVALILIALLLGVGDSAAQPAPPPATLTLKQAIALAQRASPLRAGAAAVAAGTADAARVAGRLPNPLLDVRTENWTPSTGNTLPLDIWATVSQPFELGGKRAIRRNLAVIERDVAAADLVLLERHLAGQTTQLYFRALRARGLLETVTATRDGVAMLVEVMRARLDEGFVAESDLLRFQAESARLDVDIARGTLDLASSLTALTVLTGASQPIEAVQLVTPEAPPVPSENLASIAAAIGRHPEMMSASARLGRAQQARAFEQARRLPDPSITTGYKRTLGISTMVAAVTTTIPLFDRNATSRIVADANVRAASAERDAVQVRLTSETASMVRAARTLAERAQRSEAELLQPAAGVRDAARAAFREGAADVLKVIDAERVYADVRRVALELQLEAIASAVEARIALGEEPLP